MARILALLFIVISCSGCALFVAGIAGVATEQQHEQWCQYHRHESNCWAYNTRRGSHARYH